jgi:AraC-like DNA-binding protein
MTSRLLHGEMVREADPGKAPRDHALFEQWRVDLESPCPETNGILLLEIQARLRRLALTLPAADSPKAHPHGPAPGEIDKVEAMALLIATSYSQPITAAEIASHVRLHPKYAMALFRRHCGITLGEYLTQQRLSQAQRLLVTTDSKVNDIAYSSGFGSVSRFYEVFGQSCGMSPKAYRASLRR